jgi:hypothetical protein
MAIAAAEKQEEKLLREEVALEEKKLQLINTYLKKFVENLEAYLASGSAEDAERSKASARRTLSILTKEIDHSQLAELPGILEKLDIELPALKEDERRVTGEKKEKLKALIGIKGADREAVRKLIPLLQRQIRIFEVLKKEIDSATKDILDKVESRWNELMKECSEEAKIVAGIKENENSLLKKHLLEFLMALEAKLNAAA